MMYLISRRPRPWDTGEAIAVSPNKVQAEIFAGFIGGVVLEIPTVSEALTSKGLVLENVDDFHLYLGHYLYGEGMGSGWSDVRESSEFSKAWTVEIYEGIMNFYVIAKTSLQAKMRMMMVRESISDDMSGIKKIDQRTMKIQ